MTDSMEKVLAYLGEPKTKLVELVAKKKRSKAAGAPVRVGKVVGGSSYRHITLKEIADTGDVIPSKSGQYVYIRAPKIQNKAVVILAQKLSVPAERVLYVSDIAERTFHRRQQNEQSLTPAESDRVLRIARVAAEAERVFGSAEKSSRWLSAENRILGAKPLDMLATDAGARDVENELGRIDHGIFS